MKLIYVRFSEHGGQTAIGQWSQQPFEGATTYLAVPSKLAEGLGRCADIGYEGAEQADLGLTDDEFAALGDLVETLKGKPGEAAVQ